jgi:hypothetical protein
MLRSTEDEGESAKLSAHHLHGSKASGCLLSRRALAALWRAAETSWSKRGPLSALIILLDYLCNTLIN